MNFLSNVKMKQKLILLLIIPIAGLIYFSAGGVVDKLRVLSEMNKIKTISQTAITISSLVHELQLERGMSSLYLGSKGTKFSKELQALTLETDKKIAGLKKFSDTKEPQSYGDEFRAALTSALKDVDLIREKRTAISSLNISADKVVEYYTNLNASLIDLISVLSQVSTNSTITNQTLAYTYMLQKQEKAGVERAILSNTFAGDRFSPGMLNKFAAIIAEQGTYTKEFLSLASPEMRSFYKNRISSPVIDETAKMRKTALERGDKGRFGINPSHWFKLQTEKIDLLKEVEQKVASDLTLTAERLKKGAQTGLVIFIVITVFAISAALVFGYYVSQNIIRPLGIALNVATRLAVGDTSVRINAVSDDETGQLLKAMDNMVFSLNKMAETSSAIASGDLTVVVQPQSDKDVLGNALKNMVNSLRTQTQEIMEGVNVIASSALQILTTTTQLASGASETATAVSETTATVEEVKQTVHVSNQKAKHVSETAQLSSQISQAGKKSTAEAMEAMNHIMDQMETIAESVVKLSEQSQIIGEIITAVDDLSEQSNLLAVNAAIEAAKAGEYGKGFGVVAQEIKSLAEQSRQATARVRTILNDTQKATNSAVLVTEQGSKAVEAGAKQSSLANEAIGKLADSIASSAQAAAQIAASSSQQLVGMDQVALAMDNIKQAIGQNASGAKQLETAAHNLKNLGQKLKQIIERYKV